MYGFDINYDPDFDYIKDEISKSKNVDYKLIEDKSFHIISHKCKDVRVFSYLALCYLKKNDWIYFCDIFDSLSKLCSVGFDLLFPLRLEAKRLAFKWLNESRFVEILQIAEIPVKVKSDIRRLVEALDIIKDVLQQKFPDVTPFPFKLYSFVHRWIKITEQKNDAAGQTTIQTEMKSIVQSAKDSDSVKKEFSIVSIVNREDTPKTIIDALRKNAMLLIEKEPETPIGYRLLRNVRWGSIELMPVAELNVTKIEPPVQERRFFLISLMEKGEYNTALKHAEKMFSSGNTIYWLDLQRISAVAASNLGNKYGQVRDAITLETAVFLKRYPLMRNQKFIDNTPFCNSETDEWLDREVIPVFCRENNYHEEKVKLIKGEKQDISELIASSNIESVLEELTKRRSQCKNELEEFRQMLTIASYMLSVKRADISTFILESLYEKAETDHLVKWDPSLVVELYILLFKTYDIVIKAKQGNAMVNLIEKRDEVMKKVCCLSPIAAFKIQTY